MPTDHLANASFLRRLSGNNAEWLDFDAQLTLLHGPPIRQGTMNDGWGLSMWSKSKNGIRNTCTTTPALSASKPQSESLLSRKPVHFKSLCHTPLRQKLLSVQTPKWRSCGLGEFLGAALRSSNYQNCRSRTHVGLVSTRLCLYKTGC